MSVIDTLNKLGQMITGAMRSLAPSRTGNLRRNIRAEVYREGDHQAVIGISLPAYGVYQDSGVKGSKKAFINGRVPKPFANKFTNASNQSLFAPGQFKHKYAGKSQSFDPWRASVAYYGFRPQPFIQPGIDKIIDGEGREMLAQAGVDEVRYMLNAIKDVK